METDPGVFELAANMVGSYCWAVTEVPDAPFAVVDRDKLEGAFTYKDGRKRTLTNGRRNRDSAMETYPNIYEWFIREIAGADI